MLAAVGMELVSHLGCKCACSCVEGMQMKTSNQPYITHQQPWIGNNSKLKNQNKMLAAVGMELVSHLGCKCACSCVEGMQMKTSDQPYITRRQPQIGNNSDLENQHKLLAAVGMERVRHLGCKCACWRGRVKQRKTSNQPYRTRRQP